MKYLNRCVQFICLALLIILYSCSDNAPEIPVEPSIEFESVQFIHGSQHADTIKVSFKYTDGDMDLGLAQQQTDSPFHELNFFYAINGETEYRKIPGKRLETGSRGYLMERPVPLITRRMAKLNGVDTASLPHLCSKYYTLNVYYTEQGNLETFYNKIEFSPHDNLYVVSDTFLVDRNVNYYNIEVDFLVKRSQAFEEFDLVKESCVTYDGRFPVLTGIKKGSRRRDGVFTAVAFSSHMGTVTYAMPGFSFKHFCGNNPLKLRIKIRDRALHESNVIETPEFTID